VWEDEMIGALFCSNRFKELVKKEGITGLFFADLKTISMHSPLTVKGRRLFLRRHLNYL